MTLELGYESALLVRVEFKVHEGGSGEGQKLNSARGSIIPD
jgi:hypothetical protein